MSVYDRIKADVAATASHLGPFEAERLLYRIEDEVELAWDLFGSDLDSPDDLLCDRMIRVAASAVAIVEEIDRHHERPVEECAEVVRLRVEVERLTSALAAERERCASICEAMIIGGRAWTQEQAIAAEALGAAAANIRAEVSEHAALAEGKAIRSIRDACLCPRLIDGVRRRCNRKVHHTGSHSDGVHVWEGARGEVIK